MEAYNNIAKLGAAGSLSIFTGDTGGIDSWLTSDHADTVIARLGNLSEEPLSCAQFNQLLALSHLAEVSAGFFKYYWLSEPSHPYDVTGLPLHHATYKKVDRILSIDQLSWGLYRVYVDALLCFGSVREGYRALRNMSYAELQTFFEKQRYDSDALLHRGAALPLAPISQDDRYLISEMACKSFDAPKDGHGELLLVLKGAWAEHIEKGGGRVTAKQLLESAYVLNGYKERQDQFLFAADELLESEIHSEEELIQR